MKVYLVFGDPRRSANRLILQQEVDSALIDIFQTSVRVKYRSRFLEGGFIGSNHSSSGSPTGEETYVSVLVQEDLPAAATYQALVAEGWDVTDDYPHPEQIPFLVQTVVITSNEGVVEAWGKPMWFPHAFVPTQRSSLTIGDGHDVEVRCLDMTLRRDAPHQALFVAPVSDTAPTPFFRFDNWFKIPHDPLEWGLLDRAAEALEASVTYVLGATIVTGVTIHDPEALRDPIVWSVLPRDVLDETVLELYNLGRDDLVLDAFRLDGHSDDAN